jgi:hypothetical protein
MRRISIYAGFLALALALPLAAAAEEAPGTFKIPGTDSTIKFYGYAQLDTTIDFSGRPVGYENSDWATYLPAVPADDSAAGKHLKPQTYLTARTSRFGIQTNTPTKVGAVGVKLEGDFNGPTGFQSETYTNSVVFRLRHAYGTVGGLLVGQTWSTFLDLNAAPDTVDFNGPGTLALVRNPMIRYTFGFGPSLNLAVAAENNRGPQYGVDARYVTVPDLHANLGFTGKGFTLSARAVMQTFNRAIVNGAGDAYVDASPKHKVGVAGAVSGSLKLGADTLVAQIAGGPGVGRYLLNAPANVVFNGSGDLETVDTYGVHAGYTHVWNPALRSNIVGAYSWVVDPKIDGAATPAGSLDAPNQKEFVQAFANTFWTFAKNAEFGLEYEFGQWKSFTGAGTSEIKGTQNRVTGTFHYNFF